MNVNSQKINPEKVTTPIQLLAVWFITLVLLTSAFFTAASQIHEPKWISPLLVISGILLVFIFIVLIFLMQTKYRPEMLSGKEYLEFIDKSSKDFHLRI
jgi:membrane protein YdbS with pleckstrin-like domain